MRLRGLYLSLHIRTRARMRPASAMEVLPNDDAHDTDSISCIMRPSASGHANAPSYKTLALSRRSAAGSEA